MGRYDDISVTKNDEGTREINTTMYPEIEPSANDVYITAGNDARLDNLAAQHYNDPTLWWVIANANDIKGTLYPEPGERIRIPQNVQRHLSEFKEFNDSR